MEGERSDMFFFFFLVFRSVRGDMDGCGLDRDFRS